MTPKDIVAPYNHSEIEKNAKKMKVNGYAQYELVHLTKDDREIPVEINNHLFKLEGETVALAISRDITERKKAENIIKNSLKEKEVLLKEIHHRVKNNMQIISSLLNLQSCSIDDKETLNVLQESQNRVRSMAIMHEKLYQSNDLTNLQFNDYIERLVSDLFFSYNVNKRINAVFNVDDVKLNMETAVPLGLIVSELVSNCLKHAFPNDMKGNILISLKKHEDRYILIIKDNGVGFPEDIDYKNTDSLGLQLVINLVGQIDGEIKLEKDDGTIFTIIFQEVKYKERI
jgi:two-component sensor histidine kinase